MEENKWVLIRATEYDIDIPEFFETYDEAHKEMKRQYEIFSRDCIGELNDDDAWCRGAGYLSNWRIFHIE